MVIDRSSAVCYHNHVKADGSINKLRTPNTVSAQATQPLRVFGGVNTQKCPTRHTSSAFDCDMKSPIPSKSQLEQSNGFRNIRANVSGRQIGRAIESVVIGSLQRPMIVLCV
eukprot:scaffold42564_cov46-Cyclotella_meneghiniana.AAC.2